MAYHRLLTHRGYRVPRWLEYFITACGTMALEGGPIFWVATHRVHHQNSDHEGDPHTPREGAWWSHAGWIISGRALHSETALLGRYAPDLTRDPGHVWLSRFHWLPLVLTGIAQIVIGATLAPAGHALYGAVSMLLWGPSCASPSACTPPGWSTPPPTSSAPAASTPTTTRATPGGSPSSPAARDGTITTTPTRSAPATASPGTSSTPTTTASGSSPN